MVKLPQNPAGINLDLGDNKYFDLIKLSGTKVKFCKQFGKENQESYNS